MGRPKKNVADESIGDESPTTDKPAVRDELASLISKNLNKQFKDEDQVAWFLDEPEDAPTVVTDWISTGSSLLDLAISNRPNGGLPVGKIVEFLGLEGTGKSLLAAHILAETQKKNGMAVFIDTESAVSMEFLQAIGVNVTNMLYVPLDTIEKIFTAIENIITSVRNSSKDRLVTIVVDSAAGASTDVEMEADYSKDGYATTKAILMSKALRKITNLIAKQKILVVFTNQLRMKMQAMAFSDPYCVDPFSTKIKIRYPVKY
jgi:recombination protein RecA